MSYLWLLREIDIYYNKLQEKQEALRWIKKMKNWVFGCIKYIILIPPEQLDISSLQHFLLKKWMKLKATSFSWELFLALSCFVKIVALFSLRLSLKDWEGAPLNMSQGVFMITTYFTRCFSEIVWIFLSNASCYKF